jgi:F-type H+-transporting ATPase subunit delta
MKYTAANSYSKALLLLPAEGDQQLQRLKELERILQRLEEHPKIAMLLEAPDKPKEERHKLLHEFLIDNEDPILVKFIDLLLEKKRLDCLEEIVRLYRVKVHQKFDIQSVVAITAMPLENEAMDALKSRLQEKYPNKKIEISMQVNPSVMGGLALIIDNKIIDGTIKGQLAKLKVSLLALPV